MSQKILIIEDEQLNTDRLIRILKKISPNSLIVGTLETIKDAVNWLQQNPMPDVLLMDVQLRDGLSFEILNRVNITSSIIFTTAYDEYAIKAFKYDSIDYLLKPIDENELQLALEKVKNLENKTSLSLDMATLRDLLQSKEYRHRFLLPYRDGYKSILVNDVDYFFTENRITYGVLKKNNGKIALPQTLEELDQQLDPKTFFRANRQFILHIDSINQIYNHFNGKLKVELRNYPDADILVSRERATTFKQWLDF